MNALRIGAHAYRYLTAPPRFGRVVSSFRHGVNILFDGPGVPGLVSLQTADVPLHPWAVETSSLISSSANSPAASNGEFLHAGEVSISWADVAIFPLDIQPYTIEQTECAFSHWLRMIEFIHSDRAGSADPFQPRIDEILDAWRRSRIPNLLLELIGLGAGSTPSGDDVLVGLLAGLVAQKETSALAAETLTALSESILARPLLLTPRASAQSLRAATQNGFVEPMPALVRCLARRDANPSALRGRLHALATLGSLSGRSLVRGFSTGLCIDHVASFPSDRGYRRSTS